MSHLVLDKFYISTALYKPGRISMSKHMTGEVRKKIFVFEIRLFSNSKDKVCDRKSLPIDLSLFHTSRGYSVGTALIIAIVAVIYIVLW